MIFKSCDEVLFKVHRKNLETHSEGFRPPEGTSASSYDESIPLVETSHVLELLFQYMYLQRPPDIKTIDFTILSGLAEAVEKYQVYSAMEICNIRMEYVRCSRSDYDTYSPLTGQRTLNIHSRFYCMLPRMTIPL